MSEQAADQLRQRAAHALVQVYVVSFEGVNKAHQTELFTTYYDMLLRHAFGNLREYAAARASHLPWTGSP